MACRLKKELADVEFRIAQGLDRCDQFSHDSRLLHYRHSRDRSKSLFLDDDDFEAPLDFYSRALKGNDDVTHIFFSCYSDQQYAWFAETIRDMPSVTSISVRNLQRLPPIRRDTPLFIGDYDHSQSLETFLNNDPSLARIRDTFVFMQYSNHWTIAVSFIGPSSGNLRLRLKHLARRPDINLHPISDSSSLLSFMPNIRNNLILQTSSYGYVLQDLQLLDGDGNPYAQPSQRNIQATEFDTHRMPDHPESWNFDALRTLDDCQSRDSEPQQESPSSGHDDLLADTNPVVAAANDVNLIE
jgi:hypothetical protein